MDNVAQFVDLTALVAADATLAEVQALFQRLATAEAVLVVDDGGPAGVVLRGVAQATADRGQGIRGLLMTDVVSVDARLSPLDAALRVAQAQPRSSDAFIVCDGERPLGAGSLRGLLDQLAGKDAIARTVSATQAAELADRRAFKHNFLNRMSRELRTPINGVLAMTELLERQPLAIDAQVQVGAIREAAESLHRRLRDAADLTRAAEGLLDLQREAVLLRTVLDEIQIDWQDRVGQHGVTLLMSYVGDHDLAALTDRDRLRQIFEGLIEPALMNTRAGSVEVTLKATVAEDGVHVEGAVRDTGPGLSSQQLADVFEPTDGPNASHVQLGIALARQLVLAMNGDIRAQSNVGAGVTMLFDFVCDRVEPEAKSDADSPLCKGAAHILVVDDNATNRMVAEALVEMFDCTSECAADGLEAVEIARSGRFDLILMDIKMPRMDGIAATRAIRAMPGRAGAVPIIALTANVDPEDARSYLTSGMCSVVEKPIKPDRLLQAINDALASTDQSQSAAA